MSDLCRLIRCALIGQFRSRAALEAEILLLRHQLNVMQRRPPKRVTLLSSVDRLLLVALYRLAPGVLVALKIIRPETLLRWHRAGFSSLLALEIPTTRRTAGDTGRGSPPHPRDERR